MPVSDGYLTFVLDQLRPVVRDVRARRMFGGIGLYATDLFFGLIDDDVLYLKVDDVTRPDYEARGMPAFRPYEGVTSMNYSQLPEEILEDPETLRQWTTRALDVARNAKSRGTRKTARPTGTKKKKTAAKRPAAKKGAATKRRRP
jgi:DNA transformation protein